MASPLGGSLATAIYKGMKGLFLGATLTRDVVPDSPAYDAFDPPAPVSTDYACKAVRDNYGVGHRSGGLVDSKDVKIIILQNSLSVTPQSGDRISITGQGGPWTIVGDVPGQPAVSADPANAIWECRARA